VKLEKYWAAISWVVEDSKEIKALGQLGKKGSKYIIMG
jgi:hypothetical protein